jgi:hypothetical protein
MIDFKNFDDIYEYLEHHATDDEFKYEIERLFIKLRDIKNKGKEIEEAEKAQWEIDCFNFMLVKGELKFSFSSTNNKGEIVEYPNLNNFTEKTYEYLITRLNNTSNPILKARYAHILWCSPKKHSKYAQIAVDCYLKLLKIYEQKDQDNPEKHYGLDVLEMIENAFAIAIKVKYKIDEVKAEIIRLISEFNFSSSSSFALRCNLIRLMLENKKIFFSNDFKNIDTLCLQLADTLRKNDNKSQAINIFSLGKIVSEKLNIITDIWQKYMAELYEELMNEADKNNNQSSVHFCSDALNLYKEIKDINKIKELEKRYVELKQLRKFMPFKYEIDVTEYRLECDKIAEELIQKSSEDILRTLMLNKSLLPDYKSLEKSTEDTYKKYLFMQLCSSELIDQRGNLAQQFNTEEEKKYFNILKEYRINIEIEHLYLINKIFFLAIRDNKLSAEIFLNFLNKNSWFGKNILDKKSNGTEVKYNWLNLLSPAILEYFIQIDYYLFNPNNRPNFILSIDSLTLKIEGLFRDICRFNGIATFYQKDKNIFREKHIHHLLYEEEIKKLFDEDELLFFKFLFIEQAGYNLRHGVAHAFLSFEEYDINKIHLLLLALLKIGKYDFVPPVNTVK